MQDDMKDALDVKWSDIKSPTMNPEDYVEKYKDKEIMMQRFEEYQPKEGVLTKIRDFLQENHEKLKILAIGASWCHDCADEVPRMIKIAMQLSDLVDFRVLYGVRVDPYDRKNGVRWSKRHSPPEATDPQFDLKKIPILFIFNNEGTFIGRIVEHASHTDTLEGDLLHYLKNA